MQDRYAVDSLLSPVDGGAGPDLRDDSAFLDVKDARNDARLAERRASEAERKAEGKSDDQGAADPLLAGRREWARVADGATALLAERSKDLQLAAWLTEAWLRTDGFAGLASGFALMAGLVEEYWDAGLHPQEDEDGAETRVAPLFGLFGRGNTGTLLQPIKLQPLTDHPGEAVALWTIETIHAQSTRHDDPDMADVLVAQRKERIAAIDGAVARASEGFVEEVLAALETALAQLDRLMAAVDARTEFGRFGSQVQRPLEDALKLLQDAHAAEAAPVAEVVTPDDAPIEVPAARPAPAPAAPANAPMTRERALATLLEVAAFFERNEPQSLVGPGLRDIVRRADLPMDALLRELLPEDDQRTMFLLRAGIRATHASPEDGSYY